MTFAPFPGGIAQPASGPPEIPFCVVKFDVTVPASTAYGLENGDLSFTVPNVYPTFYALDGTSGGLTSLFNGLNRFDTVWSALLPDGSAFTPNPDLLLLELQGDSHLIPSFPGSGGYPTPSTGIGFITWLNTASVGIFDLFIVNNTDPANDIRVSCECNVWRLNGDAPE